MTTAALTLGEQLDAIGRRLDETGAAWAAAGYPDSTAAGRKATPWGSRRQPWWRDWFPYYVLTVNAAVGGFVYWIGRPW